MMPSVMITHAYLLCKDRKNVRTFASYEENDELFSDRNVFPRGCVKDGKINENKTLTKNMPNVNGAQYHQCVV